MILETVESDGRAGLASGAAFPLLAHENAAAPRILGYLPTVQPTAADRFRDERATDSTQGLDVRRPDEWRQGHPPTARHYFAPHLPNHLGDPDQQKPVAVCCGSGHRASIAASRLQQHGLQEVFNIPGSLKAWKAAGYRTVTPDEDSDHDAAGHERKGP